MKNVRNSSKTAQNSTPTKRVKRLQSVEKCSFLLQKLEPSLPLPKKLTKFKSPYKTPQTQLSKKTQQQEIAATIVSVKDDSKYVTKDTPKANNAKGPPTVVSKDISQTSTVKIQPIDPFKFCEPFTKDAIKSKSGGKVGRLLLKKSLVEQKKVNLEVLAVIQKTAETIKMIRKENEEWKKRCSKVK